MNKTGDKSQIKFINFSEEEIQLNYKFSSYGDTSIISGKIIDVNHCYPICHACIKITDNNFTPICHCFSNNEGLFSIYGHFPKGIRIIVSKKGYQTYNSGIYSIDDVSLKNITIQINRYYQTNQIITGIVLDNNNQPAKNVHVVLINQRDESIIYSTYTNESGLFVLDDVMYCYYKILLCSHRYQNYCNYIHFNKPIQSLGKIYLKESNLKGTLNGIITNENGYPLPHTLVVLFDAKDDTPIQTTRTNPDGVYLFYNLVIGSYYIVAKK